MDETTTRPTPAPAGGTDTAPRSFHGTGAARPGCTTSGTGRRTVRSAGVGGGDAGMATAEYAIATLAACGFAALLVGILGGGEVRGMLLALVERALSVV